MAEDLAFEVEDDDGVMTSAELILRELASFAGLAQENMNRAAGWRFLDMGRRAERAINTVRFARQFAFDEAGEDDLDVLLTLVDCQITYRSRYLVGPLLAPVRDLVVLDPYNPRSVAFQVAALNDHIAALPSLKEHGLIERPQRLAVAAQSTLTTAEASALEVEDDVCAGAGIAQPRRRHRPALFPARAQCQPAGKADRARVIYDVRHVTTYAYESPVSFARCSLRLEPTSGDGQQLDLAQRRDQAAAGRAHRAARFLRHPYRERADRGRASPSAHRLAFARVGRSPRAGPCRAKSRVGERPRRARSRPPASARTRRSVMSLPVR